MVLGACGASDVMKWSGDSPIMYDGPDAEPSGVRCVEKTIDAYEAKGIEPYKQCIRPGRDLISQVIDRQGRWPDCDMLLSLWDEDSSGESPLFVDAGANIGSCSLLMLARGARVVAFEPVALNLEYFTRSVLKNPAFQERLELFPIALGDDEGAHTV